MAAAEARRRMKADLQAQLDRLTAQEDEERYSSQSLRHDQQRSYNQTQPHAGPSSRPDVISPTWSQPQSQYQQVQHNGWGSQADNRRTASQGGNRYHSENTQSSSHSAFRPMPEPAPMITSSGPSGSAPWQRGKSSTTRPTTFTPPTPDRTPVTPSMPNPLSASFVNIPVPSKHQLQEYLVNTMKQPLGLGMGWSIDGHVFDVYDLFVAVVRLGGSATVSRREWWGTLAVMLGVPPSINTPLGPRSSLEAARQLYAFYQLHLKTLETMWDETRSQNEGFGLSTAISHDRTSGSRIRPPVSSARGDDEESRPSTYPPPPPQHRESSLSQLRNRLDNQYQPLSSTVSSSMPLHINPEPSSSGFSLQQPPSRNNTSGPKPRQQSGNGVSAVSYARGQGPSSAPSVSTVLHQPTPARLDLAPPVQQYQTIDPKLIPIQKPASSITPAQTSNPKPSSSASQPKTLTAVPLSGYNPPKFASFDHLVATNALTLPKLPPNVVLDFTGTATEIYAKRCFELRGVVKKIQAKEPARQVSKDEMTFWQKLLAILRHNPQVVIPGSQPMSTENAPPPPSSIQTGSASQAGPSNAPAANEAVNGSQPKKNRGRPSNHDRQLADAVASGSGTQIGPDGVIIPGTQDPPAKKKRGPKPKPRPIAPGVETNGEGSASAIAIPIAGEASGILPQIPKVRKPYTIRVGTDGTPLSERFKGRLAHGNLGSVEVVHDSQGSLSQSGEAAPSTLQHAFANAGSESDALGESDPDFSRFEGPNGLAAFDAAIGYRDEEGLPVEAAFSQIAGSSTGPGTLGQVAGESTNVVPGVPKIKNPKRVEASKRRWEQRRQEQAALRASQGLPPLSQVSAGSQAAPGSQPSSSQPAPKSRGGFGVPGNAIKAATKRWSLQHAALVAPDSGSSVGVFHAVSSSPMVIASPKRIISLSGPGIAQRDREGTPIRSMGADLLRQRAGSIKPRSSLPLHLTPSRRAWSPIQPEPESELDVEYGDVMYSQAAPDLEDSVNPELSSGITSTSKSAATKGKASAAKQNKAPRSSLPSHLGSMAPPLSTDRPTRKDKGKGVDRGTATPEPGSRFILTRRESAMPEAARLAPRLSLPNRASSVSLSQPSTRGRPDARRSSSPVRPRQPSSSQIRHRLVPEIELITPRRYYRLSPVRPVSTQAQVTPIKVEPKPKSKPKPLPVKVKPKAKVRPTPQVRVKPKPKPRRPPVKYLRVVLGIRKRRRAELIAQGFYDPFRDDDSEDESRTKRYGHSGLRPKVALPRGSQARTARPQAPEVVPARFVTRGVEPELEERYRNVMSEETILKRTNEHECGWKGCDAVLASEWHLRRHVDLRRHAAQGIFKAGIYGETTLYRCHWEDCDQPCFSSLDALKQHLSARHISQVLYCPYPECGLAYSTLSHLTRITADKKHAVKHHDSTEDEPVPLADLSVYLPPPPFPDPPQHLPESARTDILTTPSVPGRIFRTIPRQEWCRLKVQNGSYAPDEPVLHIEHPPHILKPLDEDAGVDNDDESEIGSVYTTLKGGIMTEERLLDESLGRPKRRLFPTVIIRVGKKTKVGSAEDIVPTELEVEGLDQVGNVDNEQAIVPSDDFPAQQDLIPLDLVDDAAIAPTVDAPMDLGELDMFEDPIDDEITYSPVLGPRPDDILFDLSDDAADDDDQTNRSESEVWAELDDIAKMQPYTPAPIPGDYDVSDDDNDDEQHELIEEDGDVGTEAIMAAILQTDADLEEEEAAANGDVEMVGDDHDGEIELDLESGTELDLSSGIEVVEETTTTTVIQVEDVVVEDNVDSHSAAGPVDEFTPTESLAGDQEISANSDIPSGSEGVDSVITTSVAVIDGPIEAEDPSSNPDSALETIATTTEITSTSAEGALAPSEVAIGAESHASETPADIAMIAGGEDDLEISAVVVEQSESADESTPVQPDKANEALEGQPLPLEHDVPTAE